MSRQARVIAAYATVPCVDASSGKPTVYGFYHGAVLPPTADAEHVVGLVRRGYAEWVEQPKVEEEESKAKPRAKAEAKSE